MQFGVVWVWLMPYTDHTVQYDVVCYSALQYSAVEYNAMQ